MASDFWTCLQHAMHLCTCEGLASWRLISGPVSRMCSLPSLPSPLCCRVFVVGQSAGAHLAATSILQNALSQVRDPAGKSECEGIGRAQGNEFSSPAPALPLITGSLSLGASSTQKARQSPGQLAAVPGAGLRLQSLSATRRGVVRTSEIEEEETTPLRPASSVPDAPGQSKASGFRFFLTSSASARSKPAETSIRVPQLEPSSGKCAECGGVQRGFGTPRSASGASTPLAVSEQPLGVPETSFTPATPDDDFSDVASYSSATSSMFDTGHCSCSSGQRQAYQGRGNATSRPQNIHCSSPACRRIQFSPPGTSYAAPGPQAARDGAQCNCTGIPDSDAAVPSSALNGDRTPGGSAGVAPGSAREGGPGGGDAPGWRLSTATGMLQQSASAAASLARQASLTAIQAVGEVTGTSSLIEAVVGAPLESLSRPPSTASLRATPQASALPLPQRLRQSEAAAGREALGVGSQRQGLHGVDSPCTRDAPGASPSSAADTSEAAHAPSPHPWAANSLCGFIGVSGV